MSTTTEAKRDDLMEDARAEVELDGIYEDHYAGNHDEDQPAECPVCEQNLRDAAAEHAWMGNVKGWTGGNPYKSDPQSPDRSWYIDVEGWVKTDA